MSNKLYKLKRYQIQWDNIADKYLSLVSEARYSILHPVITDMVRDNGYKHILDFGCGNAALSMKIADQTKKIICVDSSRKMIKYARSKISNSRFRNNIKVYNCDQRKIKRLFKDYFDLCIVSLVLMTIPSKKEISSILNTLNHVLIKSGELLIAVTHPAFLTKDFPSVKRELPKDYKYGESGKRYKVTLKNGHGHEVSFFDYHWTIEDYGRLIRKNNFQILEIKEIFENNNKNIGDAYLIFMCSVKR